MQGFWPESADGWLTLLGRTVSTAAMAGSVVWVLLRHWIKGLLEAEAKDRKTADGNIDTRIEGMARELFNYMGKLDLLHDSLHKSELERVREMSEMRTELRTGFAKLEAVFKSTRGRENG